MREKDGTWWKHDRKCWKIDSFSMGLVCELYSSYLVLVTGCSMHFRIEPGYTDTTPVTDRHRKWRAKLGPGGSWWRMVVISSLDGRGTTPMITKGRLMKGKVGKMMNPSPLFLWPFSMANCQSLPGRVSSSLVEYPKHPRAFSQLLTLRGSRWGWVETCWRPSSRGMLPSSNPASNSRCDLPCKISTHKGI